MGLRPTFFLSARPTCENVPFSCFRFRHTLCQGFPVRRTHETHTIARMLFPPGAHRVSQVLVRLSPCMPCPEDPGRPSGISPMSDSSVLASGTLKPSPSASLALTRLYQTSGSAASPTACMVLCVRFGDFVRLQVLSRLMHGESGGLVFRSAHRPMSFKHPGRMPTQVPVLPPTSPQHSIRVVG